MNPISAAFFRSRSSVLLYPLNVSLSPPGSADAFFCFIVSPSVRQYSLALCITYARLGCHAPFLCCLWSLALRDVGGLVREIRESAFVHPLFPRPPLSVPLRVFRPHLFAFLALTSCHFRSYRSSCFSFPQSLEYYSSLF